ncbi:CLUMA_CG004104, isoform A [Clunio marinus]|uniref:CLUMA_CG004104, isoform A n=1 Tax=Clunio marinus TaxID=568069 RepID=A0A1J1HQN6_9DIPT|nr:CLUMA_CG004104, isoform A [Clunio marinus]
MSALSVGIVCFSVVYFNNNHRSFYHSKDDFVIQHRQHKLFVLNYAYCFQLGRHYSNESKEFLLEVNEF